MGCLHAGCLPTGLDRSSTTPNQRSRKRMNIILPRTNTKKECSSTPLYKLGHYSFIILLIGNRRRKESSITQVNDRFGRFYVTGVDNSHNFLSKHRFIQFFLNCHTLHAPPPLLKSQNVFFIVRLNICTM